MCVSTEANHENFVVPPAAGGGIESWTAAFKRKLETLLDGEPTIVTVLQDRDGPYIQMIVPHSPGIWLEATSNEYLTGTVWELDADSDATLLQFGWQSPEVPTGPVAADGEPTLPNWWCAVDGAVSPLAVAVLVVTTLTSVYGFTAEKPWTLETRPAACDGCWEFEP